MTANELEKAYKAAKKYGSFRNKAANYKAQDRCFGPWRTLFCAERLEEAQGWLSLVRSKNTSAQVRILGRDGRVIY